MGAALRRRSISGLATWLTLTITCVPLVACSDDDNAADPLDGVSEAAAEQLCTHFLALGDATNLARQVLDADALDEAATGYDDLADDARGAGADAFASAVEDAADAARAIAEGNRDAESGRERTGTEVLTSALRLQLADVKLRLACAERGFTVFDS